MNSTFDNSFQIIINPMALARKSAIRALVSLLTFAAVPALADGLDNFPGCPGSHCSEVNTSINEACIAAGMAGKKFPVIAPSGGVCTCPCSCVTADTLVLLPSFTEARIDTLRPAKSIFAPFAPSSEAAVDHMLMSELENAKIHQITFENGSQLKASPNHTLVKANGRINSIRNLKVGDEILTGDFASTRILENIPVTGFNGQLWNLVVASRSPKVTDHIVVTNGVQSGDYLLQSSHDRIEQEIDLRLGTVEPYNPQGRK